MLMDGILIRLYYCKCKFFLRKKMLEYLPERVPERVGTYKVIMTLHVELIEIPS